MHCERRTGPDGKRNVFPDRAPAMTIMKKLPLYITILIGMLVGTGLGFWAVAGGWEHLLTEWIKPWGTIFIRLLRLVAVPR